MNTLRKLEASCPICEHIQEHRAWIESRLEEEKNFRIRSGLLSAQTHWKNVLGLHKPECQEAA